MQIGCCDVVLRLFAVEADEAVLTKNTAYEQIHIKYENETAL